MRSTALDTEEKVGPTEDGCMDEVQAVGHSSVARDHVQSLPPAQKKGRKENGTQQGGKSKETQQDLSVAQ